MAITWLVLGAIFACFTGQAFSTNALGELCASVADCTHGVCIFDGANNAVKRCRCPYGEVKTPNGCDTIIHSDIDSNCQTCETNGGTCFDTNQNNLKDGCVCPSFRSGTDCATSHVTVDCDASSFTMRICYTKQTTIYAGKTPVMIASGKGMDMACVGVVVGSGDSICSTSGQYKLILPLDDASRGRCGTRKMRSDITTMKYENMILIQGHYPDLHPDEVSFRTSCSFDTHANARFDPVGVAVANADGKGMHYKATLTLSVENHLGNAIPEGVALRLGDQIRFKIILTLDGTYTAIRVARCFASTRPTSPDPNAITLPLVLSSCPATGQTHIITSNNWGLISGNANELQTGLVSMFKMSEGKSVHIHCSVKLCLSGSESDCAPVFLQQVTCSGSAGKRRRRSNGADSLATISRSLQWYEQVDGKLTKADAKTTVSTVGVGAVIAILGLVLIVFVAMVTSLIYRLRKSEQCSIRSSTENASLEHTPPHVGFVRSKSSISSRSKHLSVEHLFLAFIVESLVDVCNYLSVVHLL